MRTPARSSPDPLPRRGRWPAVLAWSLWALAPLGLAATAWFDHLLRQAGRPELVQLGAGGATTALAAVSAATAGAVLAGHRPAHPVGWLLLAFGLVPQALTSAADGYARYGLLVRPGALAAAFQPARRRVQQAVDRRFDRRRYDAARTVQAFSAHPRQQLDLDALAAELLTVVDQTMQPTTASLWLRPAAASRASGVAGEAAPRPARGT